MDAVLQPLTFPACCSSSGEGVVYHLINGEIELAINSSACKNSLATLITTYEAVQGISAWPCSSEDGMPCKVMVPYNLLIGNLSKLPTSIDLIALNYFESHMLDVLDLPYEIWLTPVPCSDELLSCCWRCDVVPRRSHCVSAEVVPGRGEQGVSRPHFSSARFLLGWNGVGSNFLQSACPSGIPCNILVPSWKAPLIQHTRASLLQKLTSEHIQDVIKAAAFNGYRLVFIADKPLETLLMFANAICQALQQLRAGAANVQRSSNTQRGGIQHGVSQLTESETAKLLLAGLPTMRRILAVMDTSLVLYDKGCVGNLADTIQPQTPHSFLTSGCLDIETSMASLMHKMTQSQLPLLFLMTEASRARAIMASIPKPRSSDPPASGFGFSDEHNPSERSSDASFGNVQSAESTAVEKKEWPLPLVQVSDITTFSDRQLTELFTECADFKTIVVDFQEAGRMSGRREYPAFNEIAVHEVVYERGFPENMPAHLNLQLLRNEPDFDENQRPFDDTVYNATFHTPMDQHVTHVSSTMDHFEPVQDEELKKFIQSALVKNADTAGISRAATATPDGGGKLKLSLFNFFDTGNFLASRSSVNRDLT